MRTEKEIEEALSDDRPVPIFDPEKGLSMALHAIQEMGDEGLGRLMRDGRITLFDVPAGPAGASLNVIINDQGVYSALVELVAEGIDIAITGRVDGDNLIIESVAPQDVVEKGD